MCSDAKPYGSGPVNPHVRHSRPLLLVAAVLPLLLSGCTSFWTGAENTPSPTFELTDIDGAPHNLTVHEGRYLLLDFMGTWCGPCQRGVGDLRALQNQFPEMTILSISSTDTKAQMLDFRAQYGVTWPMAVDTDQLVQRYAVAMNSDSWLWPSYALIDPTGQVIFWNRGETLPATLAVAIEDATGTKATLGSDAGTWFPVTLAAILGATVPFSPFAIRRVLSDEPATQTRLWWAAGLTAALFAALTWVLSTGGRPLTGRVLNVAGLAALAGLISIGWWRNKGTDAVQSKGRLLSSKTPWKTGLGLTLRLTWVGAPVILAVLLAAFRSTIPVEAIALVLALGAGVVLALVALAMPKIQAKAAAPGDIIGLIAASGVAIAAAWVGWMWLQ